MIEDAWPPKPFAVDWRFGRAPIDWDDVPGGPVARYQLAAERIEMIDGKVFSCDEERLMMVGLLLENLGIDRIMQLGDPRAWKEAAAALPAAGT